MSFTDDYLKLRKKRLEEQQKQQKNAPFVFESGPYQNATLTANDIAPVKSQNTVVIDDARDIGKKNTGSGLFKAGTFADGYQFGDITKAKLGTVADVVLGIVQGVAGIGEGLGDLAMYGVAGVQDLVGNDDDAERLRKATQEDIIAPLFDSLRKKTNIDDTSLLGDFGYGIAQGVGQVGAIIATGGAGSAAGLGTVGTSALTTGMIGASSMGSGMSEAYKSGATDEEALAYGAMSGVIDAGTEMIFGGLGKSVKAIGVSKGISSLDDVFAKKISSKISNQFFQNAAEYGIKAGAEGLEEVLAGLGSAAAKKLTYMSEEELSQLVEDENLLEQFVAGTIVSGIAQSGDLVKSTKQGRDFITNFSGNEEMVIEKVYNDRVAEAEQDGTKLTNKEKNKLYEQVQEDMRKGYISTDTIESVLGGETYKSYKDTVDSEDAILKEFDELGKKQNATLAEQSRYAELQAQVKEIKSNSNRNNLKSQLSEEVYNSVKEKDFYLAESYNERARRGTAFEADLSQYDDKTAETVKRAIDSGILNNTRRTHEFVDMVAKISADKGVLFDFTNNEKLKESGFAVNGASINGYVTKDGITVNISSSKATNSIVGHEITHVLEGTELYAEMQKTLFEYSKSKNDYDSRRKALEELYKNVEGADIDAELTADLVGDYLFTDADFINNLSTKHRNVFQKIYDEIKYLLKIATKGSKEARQLEKVKRTFEKAYRANGNTNEGTKYSLSDSDGKKLTKEQSEYFKDSKMRDENGNLKVMYHGSQYAGFHEFDSDFSDDNKSFFFVDRNDVAASYSGTSETYAAPSLRTAEDFNKFFAENGLSEYSVKEEMHGDYKWFVLYEDGAEIASSETAKMLYDEFRDWTGLGEGEANYKVYLDLKNPLEVDAKGRPWNKIDAEFSQEVYDKYQSLTAEEKAALTDLAEWEDFRLFNSEIQEARDNELASAYAKMGEDCNIYDLFSVAADNFSEDSLRENSRKYLKTRDYAQRAKEQGYDGVIFKNIVDNGGFSNGSEGASTVAIAFESNQIKSVANEKPTGNADIRYSLSSDSEGRELSAEQREYFKNSKIVDDNGSLKVMHHGSPETFTVFDKKKAKYSGTYGKGFYFSDSISHASTYGELYDVYLNITNPLQNGTNDITKEQIRKFVEAIAEDEDYGIDNYGYDATIDSVTDSVYGKSDFGMILDLNISCVGDMVEAIELFNKVNGTNYNGIVAPTETVAFYPEQIKNIDNKAPTSNPDIRFSLSESVEETKDLIAVHNLSEEKLVKSLNLGGLPMPSIAIARAKDGHSNFGNISLVFNKETIDPQFMRSNKVYSGDAWTPTYPRVEYKLNDKALKQIRDKISSLVSYDVLTDVGNAHLDSDNMTDTLNRFGGNVAEAFKYDDGLKYAYLKDTGANITLPMKKKNLSYYGYRENGAIIRVAEALSAEELKEALNGDREAQEKIEPIVRRAVAEYTQEKYGNEPELLDLMMPKEKLTFSDLDGYISEALNYHRKGVQQTVDTKAARELIREQVNQAEYENWLKNLFSDIVEKEGIRNDKDLFTPSGNRRSFEALHYEHNLENVIKAMKEKGDKGIGAWGGGNIFGAATTEYGSISEIKSEAQNRMKLMSESEYEEIRKGFSDRFFELAHSLPIHKDSFVATDDAANMLIEAVAKYKTKSGMANYLRNESKGWANYSDYVVEDLIQLVSAIRSMPVGYFEAKPQRAVGFNEVAAAIIPDSTNAELKQILTDKGIPFIEYESGNEQARLEALNSLEEAKFSLSKEGETPKRYGNYNIFGEDIRLEAPTQEEVAPIQEDVAPESEVVAKNAIPTEDVAPIPNEPTIYDLEQKQAELEDTIRKAMESNDPNAPKLIDEYGELLDTIAKRKKEESTMESERIASLDDADVPPEMEAPYYGESTDTTPENPFEERDIKAVGNRQVKAYMYENPEVKPFFQEEANRLLKELRDGTKGERWFNDQLYYDSGGEYGFSGTKRHVSADIAYLLDNLNFSYADIEKGINAIIEDNGKENNAASKRIEFILNDRLLKGYTDFTFGYDVPPNQDYINLLNEKQIIEYSDEARAKFFEVADEYAPPMEDIAPVAENTTVNEPKIDKPIEDIAPTFNTKKKGEIEGQQTMFEEEEAESEPPKVATILTEEPEVPKKKNRAFTQARTNLLDKGSVFEDLSLKTGNRELQGKYNFMHYSEARAQKHIADNLKPLVKKAEQLGKSEQLYEYVYHLHNIDRMSLETEENRVKREALREKFKGYSDKQIERIAMEWIKHDTPKDVVERIKAAREYIEASKGKNKPVFGDTVTADVSRDVVRKLEAENPEFKELSKEIIEYNAHLRQMLVDAGVISQETADLWAKMYPHYVPIRRLGDEGLSVNVPLDTNKTGVNAPIKRATGGNRDIMPLFDTMAMRTEQTFKAIAKNNFGTELMHTLDSTVESNATSLDDVIDSFDNHEELLQEGKNGKNPTFTVFENGKRVTFEITEDMYDALKPTSKGLSYTNKVANTASNIFRGILTEYNPVFMVSNAAKDIQDVLINSQHAAKTYANIPRALKELTTKGRWYTEYMENGGEQNTYFDSESKTFKEENKGFIKTIGMPLRAISTANNFIERIPRLAEYIASREAGASVEVAMLDATRVTTNFAAGGDVTKFLNRNGATFLNASVQGFNQNVRNVREAKANGLKGWVKLTAKVALAGVPALLLNNLLWDDDEEYEELSEYVKDKYYIVAKTEDGKFIRIPKGRVAAVIQDAFEQINNVVTGNDEVDFKNFFNLVISNLAPNNPIENNILAPIIQVANNKTWYGEDLVPTRLQDLPAGEQFDESTDVFSKWLGEKTNISPYKLNYLLNQYSGGVGDVFLPMLTPEAESGDNSFKGNILAPMKDKFTTDSTLNNKNVSAFYDTMDELTTNAKSSKATDEDILKYKYFNSINAELSELYAQKREIQNSDLADDEKYEAVRELQEQINDLARESLNTYENVYISDGYASIGDIHYRWYEPGEDSDAEAGWQKITDKQLEKQEAVTSYLGVEPSEYWKNKTEYDFAYEYPEKYSVAKSVGGYSAYKRYTSELYDIKADKDEDGKSISGSRKEKVIEYVNNLDIDYGARLILFKSEYNADDTYNYDIIDYLNNRQDISYEDMETILKELGFTVLSDGTIQWD